MNLVSENKLLVISFSSTAKTNVNSDNIIVDMMFILMKIS
jgi:hypothetical protein